MDIPFTRPCNGIPPLRLYSKMLNVIRVRVRPDFLAALLVMPPLACIPGTAAAEQSPFPQQLVREAVQNEMASGTTPTHFMFKDQRKTSHLSQTKLLVETSEATAGMIIEQNGHALDEQQRNAEEARLENYVRNPEELKRKRKQEKEDDERTERIMKALPDAFIYHEDGTTKGSATVGSPGDDLVRLNFQPNPAYNPPTRVEQVLTGMAGHLLIDAKEKRIAEIDGMLEKEVGFGWGILGHLDKGGRFLVQQAEVVNHVWDVTCMQLAFTGKILLFKRLNIQSTDIFSEFRTVPPNLTFAQGLELLKKEALRSQSASINGVAREPTAKAKSSGEGKVDQAQQLYCDH